MVDNLSLLGLIAMLKGAEIVVAPSGGPSRTMLRIEREGDPVVSFPS